MNNIHINIHDVYGLIMQTWPVADNLAIVVIAKKRFLQAEEVFHNLTLSTSSRHASASVNYHDDTDSETTGSDDRFQGLQPSP